MPSSAMSRGCEPYGGQAQAGAGRQGQEEGRPDTRDRHSWSSSSIPHSFRPIEWDMTVNIHLESGNKQFSLIEKIMYKLDVLLKIFRAYSAMKSSRFLSP